MEAFEAGDFLYVFPRFLGFETHFFLKNFLIKKELVTLEQLAWNIKINEIYASVS